METENHINKLNLAELRRSPMVQALVEIDENTNRVLNVVKAKYNLQDKGEAIEFVVSTYIENKNEPELRPEFIKKIQKIRKQKSIKVADFAKRYNVQS